LPWAFAGEEERIKRKTAVRTIKEVSEQFLQEDDTNPLMTGKQRLA
jgi:hypothetical protein